MLELACGFRQGIVGPVQNVDSTFADIQGVHNAFLVGDTGVTQSSSSGGFARTRRGARAAAIGEALERYSAALTPLPLRTESEVGNAPIVLRAEKALFAREQHAVKVDAALARYANVFDLRSNTEAWAPHELVGLGTRVPDAVLPSTSTGLAAHFDPYLALLRGTEEVLERDALMVTWYHSLGGREIPVPAADRDVVERRGGNVRAFDLTQRWNPHPVVAVAGVLPMRGRPRIALGVACRGDYAAALEKAYLEWLQGIVFVGYYFNEHPTLSLPDALSVRTFEHHAMYYSLNPDLFSELPLLARAHSVRDVSWSANGHKPREQLDRLSAALSRCGVALYYRDLTTPDVARLGLTVVRVLGPSLSLLHADERAPFFGARFEDVAWRYPHARECDRSSFPHPLG